MDEPIFSVIIPVYNRPVFVQNAIASVARQSVQNFELIVVDDGSTDETPAVLSAYADRAQILTQPNKGPGAARNLGAKSARGDFLAFLDSDDLWLPWTLAAYRRVSEKVPDVAIILGSTMEFREEREIDELVPDNLAYTVYRDYLATARASIFRGSGVMAMRRDLFSKSGGFSEKRVYSEDLDFLLRCGLYGPIAVISKPVMLARRAHSSGSTSDMMSTYQGALRLLDAEKNNRYPGEKNRQGERQRLLCHQARAVCNWCLKASMKTEAFDIYRRTFLWQLRFGQISHLIKIPLLAKFPWLRKVRAFLSAAQF
jgi:glycosyltransferase involved in cell wall biosynthesis